PMHWSWARKDLEEFNSILKAGLQYFPKKFGYVFCEGTHNEQGDETKVFSGSPFQLACMVFGQEKVLNEVVNRIAEYCSTTATCTRTTTNTEMSLLIMSAVTDESIHLDGLYILLRRDPTAALLGLQQQLLHLVGKGQTSIDTDTDTDTNTTSNNSNTNAATSNSTSTSSNTTIAASSTDSHNNNNIDDDTHSPSRGKKRKNETTVDFE
ncbi:MAG: hypothetical protein ACI8RD_012919, partial [Bacillariaceae sp.]